MTDQEKINEQLAEEYLETPEYLRLKIQEQVDKLVEVSGGESTKEFLKTIKL